MSKKILTVGHSPDPDDAFMFYALAHNRIDTGDYEFRHHIEDIDRLNQRAFASEFEITALSLHAYCYVAGSYQLLSTGASVGDGYGPIIVSRRPLSRADLEGAKIAIPGVLTTATLTLKLFLSKFEEVVVPFDRILSAVASGEVDAGVIIHEGQLTYVDEGLHKVADLGAWWKEETGLPLPLGINAVRRDLGMTAIREAGELVRQSIEYGLTHRQEALEWAMQYGRGMDEGRADQFVGMYVNDYTRDLGDDGRRAVAELLDRAYAEWILSVKPRIEYV
ncbi:MAG: ABC transporter substrate-binding protein [Armatimonadetes bacterium CG_4_10_14_3_um_filter_66_18]|nr:ABC transporter substrate-binding protein [Armatimonadota bacterium]OIO97811.1 MAG: ABC transporter substrate-binding protein [Armatimonadetes bacterium CG2_30_66_41]PIU95366.1 MAG: ABC transporter substrate-binding protein [Armatimonadetes bacterium CG06_land_8_20_14_3_00_66_21]PIX37786.1 MAG: ABC transporter substrate-binding protein [Armatimonadetes bacterium CG_4_8_14_3_um_filter_66_20]PIY46185.1 MAG: ABC transporter substrate-binding protein [Armatimonadetes bacterium CG_4_10_14_3_um_fi